MSDGLVLGVSVYRTCVEKVLNARLDPSVETEHLLDEIEQEYRNSLIKARKRTWLRGTISDNQTRPSGL